MQKRLGAEGGLAAQINIKGFESISLTQIN